MSAFDEIETTMPTKTFRCPAGFARITRKGVTDVYLVQNQEYPGEHFVTLAFEMDDFDQSGKNYGEPLVVMAHHTVDFLGTRDDYFSPGTEKGDIALALLKTFPQEVGLLPVVRAVESITTAAQPNTEHVAKLVQWAKEDYHRRRAELTNNA